MPWASSPDKPRTRKTPTCAMRPKFGPRAGNFGIHPTFWRVCPGHSVAESKFLLQEERSECSRGKRNSATALHVPDANRTSRRGNGGDAVIMVTRQAAQNAPAENCFLAEHPERLTARENMDSELVFAQVTGLHAREKLVKNRSCPHRSQIWRPGSKPAPGPTSAGARYAVGQHP